ncbi:hypothetical protein WDU94_010752 [Cyamophila willieti]
MKQCEKVMRMYCISSKDLRFKLDSAQFIREQGLSQMKTPQMGPDFPKVEPQSLLWTNPLTPQARLEILQIINPENKVIMMSQRAILEDYLHSEAELLSGMSYFDPSKVLEISSLGTTEEINRVRAAIRAPLDPTCSAARDLERKGSYTGIQNNWNEYTTERVRSLMERMSNEEPDIMMFPLDMWLFIMTGFLACVDEQTGVWCIRCRHCATYHAQCPHCTRDSQEHTQTITMIEERLNRLDYLQDPDNPAD